jgi:hypothetical protein
MTPLLLSQLKLSFFPTRNEILVFIWKFWTLHGREIGEGIAGNFCGNPLLKLKDNEL